MTIEEWIIDAVKARPIIWNTKDENYKNTKMKNDAYNDIAKDSELSADDIKKKWHSIRSAFSRELRMRNLYSNVSQNQKREWRHFNKLMFLLDECGLELDGQVENDFTISIVSGEDGSSTLYHLPNSSNANSTLENGQSTAKNNSAKKRKTNQQATLSKNTLMQSNINLPKFARLSEEEVFGQSIAASLRKFDDKKKEIVKLKLQEVIVQYLNE